MGTSKSEIESQLGSPTPTASSSNRHPPSLNAPEEYIFAIPGNDLYPLANSYGNPTTSKIRKVEDSEAYQELGYRVYEVKEANARALYHELADGDRVSDFLKTPQSGYDVGQGIWTALAQSPTTQSSLCGIFTDIMNTIIKHFHPSFPEGVGREAVDSRRKPLIHDNGSLFTMPGICIKATGPSFELPEHADLSSGLGYTSVAAVIDVQPDAMKGKRMMHCKRLTVYNRQIFVQQPNRHFARSMVLTEKVFRIVHHDRSSIYVSPFFDINKDAALFVRYVVGLTSSNEQHLGLDTSVQWIIDPRSGKKVAGTIELSQVDDAAHSVATTKYDLDMTQVTYVRPDLRGRGTVAWHALDPASGEPVLVKDSWHTDSRESECKYLLEAQGIPGIVEMVAFQDCIAETADYRPPGFKNREFRNRSKLRVATKKYGKSVWFFRSRLQLVYAFRDALAGHHALFERGVIHRDVSLQNLLLGRESAPDGYRGILIDLDMACRTENHQATVLADPDIGTRMYQSISVIQTRDVKPQPPQDYMDDLESFFYVLCHIIYSFKQPGVIREKVPEFLKFWDMDDLPLLLSVKQGFALKPTDRSKILPYWRGACVTLLQEFQEVIRTILYKKIEIQDSEVLDTEGKLEAYGRLSRESNVYYERVKAAFDKAITDLEEQGLNQEELEPYPTRSSSLRTPSLAEGPPTKANVGAPAKAVAPKVNEQPTISPVNSPTGKKRPSGDDGVEASSKRPKDAVPPQPPTTETVQLAMRHRQKIPGLANDLLSSTMPPIDSPLHAPPCSISLSSTYAGVAILNSSHSSLPG
ncbi:hypothetical protein NMY22_g4983 [Coprinellus aureogranulatus]|nr:hypothetical protein NMY22_g4983 [Coprinellus aureogranulatus]